MFWILLKNIIIMLDILSCSTTLALCFSSRDEPPKPTTALDFCYARKAKQNNMVSKIQF